MTRTSSDTCSTKRGFPTIRKDRQLTIHCSGAKAFEVKRNRGGLHFKHRKGRSSAVLNNLSREGARDAFSRLRELSVWLVGSGEKSTPYEKNSLSTNKGPRRRIRRTIIHSFEKGQRANGHVARKFRQKQPQGSRMLYSVPEDNRRPSQKKKKEL